MTLPTTDLGRPGQPDGHHAHRNLAWLTVADPVDRGRRRQRSGLV